LSLQDPPELSWCPLLIADPLTQRYHWHVKKPLNIARMQAAGNELVGTHDFTTLKGKGIITKNYKKKGYYF